MSDQIVESVMLLVVGMSGVFVSLLLLAGMIWLFKFADERFNAWRIRTYARKVEANPDEEGINDEVAAVIAAAVTAALKRPVVIRRMRFLGPVSDASWAVTGRLNIMASHLIPKRKS
jgi:sodium pump decarboxylase gamma subunit